MSSPAGSTRSSEFGNDGYKYKCTICGIGFQYKKGFNHHMNIHAEKHPCQECKKYFGNKEELRIHKRSHPVKKRVPCPTCHRSFVCLHTHVKSCSKKNSKPENVQYDSKTGHKQYEIPNFRSDQKIHTDKLKCDICDKRWPSSSELFRHKRTHIDRMVNHVPITPDIDNHVPLFELSDSSFEEPPAEAVDPWRDYFCLHATEPSVEKFDGGEVNTAPVVIRADPSVEPRHNVIDNVEFKHVPEGDRHGPVIDLWHSSFEELLSEAVDQPSTSTELYQRLWIEEGGMDYHAPDDHNEPQEAKVAETKSTRIAQNGSGKKDEISAAKQKRGASLRESSKLIVEDPLAKKPSTEEDLKTILKQMNGDFAKKMEQQKRDFEKQIEQQKNEKNQLKENYEERIVQQKKDFEAKMKQSEHFILEEPSTIAGRPPSTIENSFGKKIGNLARESVPLAGSFNFEELNVKKARTGVDFDEIVSQLKNDFVQKMEQQSKDFDEKIVLQMRGYQRRDESQRGAVDSERDQKQAPNLQSRKRKKFRRHDYHSRNWKISSSEDESDESPAEGSVSGVPIGRSNHRNTKKTTGSHQETGTADVFITYADLNLPNRCVFCWKQDHPSDECRHFNTVEYRLYMKERSNLCPKCLLFHPGKLCFKTVKCDHCQAEDHHSYLCPSDTHRQYLGQFCK